MADNLLDKASILLTPTAYNNGRMLSVKPYENLYGSENIVNGDFSNGSTGWTISGSASVGVNKLNLNAGAFDFFAIQTTLTNGLKYKVTLDAEVTSGDILLYTGTQFGTISSSGSYTFYTTSDSTQIRFRSGGSGFVGSITNVSVVEDLSGDFTFSRNGNASRTDSSSNIVTESANLPRIDYTDGCGNWLLEPQSTNLITYSEDFSDSSWANINSSETSGFLAPNGQNDAFRFLTTSGTSSYLFASNISVSNLTEYTISCYAKSNDNGLDNFKFYTSAGFSPVITAANEWQRFEFTVTTNSTSIDVGFNGQSTNTDILIWGFQIEQQSYATSYIPTSGATNTRLQDIATNSGNSTLINSTEGVLYAEIAALAKDSSYKLISLKTIDYNNRIEIGIGINNKIHVYLVSNSTNLIGSTEQDFTIDEFFKVALKWSNTNGCTLYINGSQITTAANSTFSALDFNALNFNNFFGNPFYGKTKALAVYKEALTDAELQSLTTI